MVDRDNIEEGREFENGNYINSFRAFFMIFNLVLAIIGFSYMVGAQFSEEGIDIAGKNVVRRDIPLNNPSSTPTPAVNPGSKSLEPNTGSGSNTGSVGGQPRGGQTTPGGGGGVGSVVPDPAAGGGTPAPGGQVSPDGNGGIPNIGGGGTQAPGGQISPGTGQQQGAGSAGAGGLLGGINGLFNQQSLLTIGTFAGIGAGVGAAVGGKKGALSGAIAGLAGGVSTQLFKSLFPNNPGLAFIGGLAVSAIVFLLLYKKEVKEVVDFSCLPYQPPIGGNDCSLCNEYSECSEYTCKSLGQACGIVNEGTDDVKCVWINPRDVNSPKIEFKEVSEGHKFVPDRAVRPPAIGVEISLESGECIKAFTPLEFKFDTNEPAQCKIDYDLTTEFENMNFYVGGSANFLEEHTEELSLPGPDAINFTAPELQNDGEYTLFVRCQDANGNFNQDPFSVKFCVEKGPDTTPPRIDSVNVPSGSPIKFNQSSFDLEVYVNEPSECKWSRSDISYDNMENDMECDLQLFQINNQNLFTCRATLTGIEDRKDNEYYFRCKDQPFKPDADRNVNVQSSLYKLIGTQPLNIVSVEPGDETIFGSTDVIPVFLKVNTDNGYQNGEAVCSYNTNGFDDSYLRFLETDASQHVQRQDLSTGNYDYYIQCVDLGGNAAFNKTSFRVESDRLPPAVVRVYKDSGDLKIITNEKAECSYSNADCNFEIESGIQFTPGSDFVYHTTDWRNSVYYVKCSDRYDNQPNPNECSIVVKPSELSGKVVL